MAIPSRIGLLIATVLTAALTMAAPAAAHDDKPQLPPWDIPNGHIGTAFSENVEYVGGRNGWTGGHLVTRGDRLYIGSYGIGLRVYDISDRESPKILGAWQPVEPRADAVPEAGEFDGRHIAALNGTRRTTRPQIIRTDRSEFLDFTDPAKPILLHEFVGADDGEAHVGHFLFDQRVWVPAGGSGEYGGDGGLEEADRPAQSYAHHRGFRLYDLDPVIDNDPQSCEAHAGWDNPCAPELLFAANPVEMWEKSPHRNGREVGHDFTHTHDATPHEDVMIDGLKGPRDIILLAEGGSYLEGGGNTGSVFVIDVTGVADGKEPVVLNRFIHPGYDDDREHDSIRYYHEAQLLDGDPSVMMVTDEDMHSGCEAGGAIYFVRLSADFTKAQPLSEWHIPSDTPAPVCSVHNFSSDGNLVYIGSYNAGLQVVDVSDPTAPERAGYFIAEGATTWGAYFYDGYVYLGDMVRGLDIVQLAAAEERDPTEEPTEDPTEETTEDGVADTAEAADPASEPSLPATGNPALLTLLGVIAVGTAGRLGSGRRR